MGVKITIDDPSNITFEGGLTVDELYEPLIKFDDDKFAKTYFQLLVYYVMTNYQYDLEAAEDTVRINILFYCERYTDGTQMSRMRRLFGGL